MVGRYCWRRPRRGKSTCVLGDKAGHGISKDDKDNRAVDAPLGYTARVEKVGPGETNKDDVFANKDDRGDDWNDDDWLEIESDEEEEELNDEQVAAGYVKIGRILRERGGGRTGKPREVLATWCDGSDPSYIAFSALNRGTQILWEFRPLEDQPLYVNDVPVGDVGTKSRPKANVFDFDRVKARLLELGETPEEASTCNTEKDRDAAKNLRTCGILAGVTMCGVCSLFVELYRAEGKTQVALAVAEFLRAAAERGETTPMTVLYDDACHLRMRAQTLQGQRWEMAALAILDIILEPFHAGGHVDGECVRELNPATRPVMQGRTNGPVAEQVFRRTNAFARFTFQRPGGRFRLFYALAFEFRNRFMIAKEDLAKRGENKPTKARPEKKPDKVRKARHAAALEAARGKPLAVPAAITARLEFDPRIVRDGFAELVAPGGILYDAHHRTTIPPAEKRATNRKLRLWYCDKAAAVDKAGSYEAYAAALAADAAAPS